MKKLISENTGKIQANRWGKGQSGNPAGKPVGARNRATLAAQTLLEGEAEALTRKAVEMALGGEMTALRLCLERILPPRKDSPVVLPLPTTTTNNIVQVQFAVLQAVGAGDITPQEGTALCSIVESVRKAVETEDFEKRLSALEASKPPQQDTA